MSSRPVLITALSALLILILSAALGASPMGKIEGTVVDDMTGQPVAEVSVQVSGTKYGAKTDSSGRFTIEQVPPGTYKLIFSAIGYSTSGVDDVVVEADQTVFVDFRIKPRVLSTGKVTEVKGVKKEIGFHSTGTRFRDTNYKQNKVRSKASDMSEFESEVRSKKYPASGSANGNADRKIISSPKPGTQKPQCPPYPDWPPFIRNQNFDDMYFRDYGTNPFVDTRYDPLSTFAVDVDNASYVLTRSYLERNDLPPADAVRVEEYVNRFDYGYRATHRDVFGVDIEGAPSRFGRNSYLMRIGIKGREIADDRRKPAHLVFVIDVSGSMNRENRLGLVKRSLYYLVDEMEKTDRIGIVTFNTTGRVVLPMTSVRHRHRIFEAIDNLHAGGSTNADDGLRLGYGMAHQNFDVEKINRIIMCSDGVANTGTTDPEILLRKIREFADMGIILTTIGVGMGNYNDILLEKLGDKGNGHYAYIDDLEEARQVFVENLTGNLEVIARDVKIQVDFDPEIVRSYRLLGFENRDVADHKFRDDREDGGEIGAGHEVTALYEITLRRHVRYVHADLGRIFIRFKDADGFEVSEINRPITWSVFQRRFHDTSSSFRLAAAAAEFAEILKGTPWSRGSSMQAVYNLARDVYEERPDEDVRELMNLIERASRLRGVRAER